MIAIFRGTLKAGLTLSQRVHLPAYAGATRSLRVSLRGPQPIDIDGTQFDCGFDLVVSADVTKLWKGGRYWYTARVTDDDGTFEIDSGDVVIEADLIAVDNTNPYDGRDHTQRVIDAIEAVIENRATLDQESYRINNRELKRTPIAELLALRDRYRIELQRNKAGKNRQFGQSVRLRM